MFGVPVGIGAPAAGVPAAAPAISPALAAPKLKDLIPAKFDVANIAEWATQIQEVPIGNTSADGGSRGKRVLVGGEKALPFFPDAPMPNRNQVTIDVFDMRIGLAKAVKENYDEVMQKASDKLNLSKKLEALGIPHPRCYSPEELDAIEYPVMIKPASGGGGIFNRIARNRQELLAILEELHGLNPELTEETIVIQEFLEGTPSSVSLLSTKNEALSVAVNEQLIGIPWLSRLPFAYCGNITPFRTDQAEEMEALAEELVLEFKLLGSNGVDFLASKKGPVVLEINPRFQGSLDTVEKAMNINLFEAHELAQDLEDVALAVCDLLPQGLPCQAVKAPDMWESLYSRFWLFLQLLHPE